jgi:hypothetical protein
MLTINQGLVSWVAHARDSDNAQPSAGVAEDLLLGNAGVKEGVMYSFMKNITLFHSHSQEVYDTKQDAE